MNIKDIDILKIQDSLDDKTCIELDFQDDVSLLVCKNDIFVKYWDTTCVGTEPIPSMPRFYEDNFENYSYKQIRDFETEDLEDLIEETIDKCRYTKDC